MKLERIRKKMNDQGVDLVILAPGTNMAWAFGFSPFADERACLALIGHEDVVFVAPSLNAADMRNHTDHRFEEWTDASGPRLALQSALGQVAPSASHIAIDDTMRADHALMILDEVDGLQRSMASELIGPLRMIKTKHEIDALRENAHLADIAQQTVWSQLSTAKTEQDMYRVAQDCFEAHGAKIAFGIIGGGENSSYPHHHTGQSVLAPNVPIVIDIGACKDGYYSDITRMAAIGEVTAEYHEVHGIVDQAVQAALARVKPGVMAREIDDAARSVITDAGYGEYFTHRTGHGVGMDIHEGPFITANNTLVLEEGMVFTIEPGIYLPQKFGIRLEEVVVVTATGCEILSKLSRDLQVVT